MDSGTYATTVDWTAQDGSQSIGELTEKLRAERTEAEKKNVIPAIIDAAAAQALGESAGQQVALSDSHGSLQYVVEDIVHALPTIYDAAGGGGLDTSIPQGGVLVDFATYNAVALAMEQYSVSATNVWVRSSTHPDALASVRTTLFSGTYALVDGEDQRVLA